MMARWQALSSREKLLVAIMLVLLGCAAIQFLVINPIRDMHHRAVTRVADAELTKSYVERAIAIGGQNNAVAAGPIANIVTDSSNAVGLRLVRRNLSPDGERIEVVFENVNLAIFNQWLIELERNNGIVARQGSIRPQGNGLYAAQFVFTHRGAAS